MGRVWEIIDQNISYRLEIKMKEKYQAIGKIKKENNYINNKKEVLKIHQRNKNSSKE
jgi:hypothetical protein